MPQYKSAHEHWLKRAHIMDGFVDPSLLATFRDHTTIEGIGNGAGQVPVSIKRGGEYLFRILTEAGYDECVVAILLDVSLKDVLIVKGLYQRGADYVQGLQDDIRKQEDL